VQDERHAGSGIAVWSRFWGHFDGIDPRKLEGKMMKMVRFRRNFLKTIEDFDGQSDGRQSKSRIGYPAKTLKVSFIIQFLGLPKILLLSEL